MKRQTAEKLLTEDFSKMSLEQLQKYRVKLLDALRESTAEYGYEQAVKDGYYRPMGDPGASGFSPRNIHLSTNLNHRFLEVDRKLQEIYAAEGLL